VKAAPPTPSFFANRFVQEVGQPSCIFCFGVFLFHAVAKMDKEKLWCIPHQPPLTLYTPLYYLSLILNLTLVSLVVDYLLRFILTVTCCVLSGTWKYAHSLTHSLTWIIIKICAKHQHQLISWGKWQKKNTNLPMNTLLFATLEQQTSIANLLFCHKYSRTSLYRT